jgi:circadian clock protein KaiB
MDSPQPESAPEVLLRLFVTGNSQRSLRAVEGIQGMCKEFFGNGVRLEVVDVIEHPDEAEREKILATPTLIRQVPQPRRRLVGDMAEPERLIQLLGLRNFVRPRKA